MRAVALVSIVLFACDVASSGGPAPFDSDLPARLDCTTAGYFTPGGGHNTWRGTLDTASGAFDFVEGPLHEDAPFPGEIEYRETHVIGTATWGDDTLDFEADGVGFTLARLADVAGFVVGGTIDVGAFEPVGLWCWNPGLRSGFAYDADDGVCRDADGNEGTEPRPVQIVRETGDGQCADLRGVALDEFEYAYQAWSGFDLRGADLSGASLHFADIADSALEGANMDGLDYGYSQIRGTIDAHTTIPAEGCEVEYASIACFR